MNLEEAERRITLLEMQHSALQALVHALLQASPPTQQRQAADRFQTFASAMEAQTFEEDIPDPWGQWQRDVLAEAYTSLQASLAKSP